MSQQNSNKTPVTIRFVPSRLCGSSKIWNADFYDGDDGGCSSTRNAQHVTRNGLHQLAKPFFSMQYVHRIHHYQGEFVKEQITPISM
jgi:hypothetical protein